MVDNPDDRNPEGASPRGEQSVRGQGKAATHPSRLSAWLKRRHAEKAAAEKLRRDEKALAEKRRHEVQLAILKEQSLSSADKRALLGDNDSTMTRNSTRKIGILAILTVVLIVLAAFGAKVLELDVKLVVSASGVALAAVITGGVARLIPLGGNKNNTSATPEIKPPENKPPPEDNTPPDEPN